VPRGGVTATVAAIAAAASPLSVAAQSSSALDAERALAERSAREGLGTALSAALAADGVLVWPGAPVAIGTNAGRLLAGQPVLDSLRLLFQPLALERSADSALTASWGIAVAADRHVVSAPRLGRYIALWIRRPGTWRLSALLLSGLVSPTSTVLPQGLARSRPRFSIGRAGEPFARADLDFAKLAGDSGARVAFARYAAPTAMMLDGRGLVVRGPEAVGELVAGPARWRWYPVAGGAAGSGDLGWTAGEAVITPPVGEGAPAYSKYLTVWRRLPDGSIRFLTDGGNPRPGP
jgi:hypothetical protein